MKFDELHDLTIDELFNVLESAGVNCTELKKARGMMNNFQLRENLFRLLENHIRHQAYKDFQSP